MPVRKNEAQWIESRQRWQIKVQIEGERKTFTSSIPGTKGKITAEKAADKWIVSRHTADVRLEVLWKDHLAEIKTTTGSANYVKHESMGRLWLLPRFGKKKISSITNADWQSCVNKAFNKGLSKKTCENIRASITALYSYASKRRAPMERPEHITIPKGARVKEKNILQPHDIKLLFAHDTFARKGQQVPCFFIHAWRLLVLTGMRRGEVAGLQKGDIKDGVLYIRRAINSAQEITGGKNKTAKRYIVLSERQKNVLKEQAEMLKRYGIVSKWIFPDQDGGEVAPNHIYNEWAKYRNTHGIKATIHEMRHTLISVAQADVPDQLLKRMVGHTKSMDTFGVYGHDVDGQMKRASDLLDGIFNKILTDN